MAENGHYWQVEGENASAQIIDNVLSDLSDALVEGPPIGEEEKIAVIRVPADPDAEPGTKESRDHFELGEAGGGDIDAEEDQVLVGDGEDWAKGNIAGFFCKPTVDHARDPEVSAMSIATYSKSGCAAGFGTIIETDGDFVLKNGFRSKDDANALIQGKAYIEIGEDGVDYQGAGVFWSDTLSGPDIKIKGCAKVEMTGGSQSYGVPAISMRGNCLIDMHAAPSADYYNFTTSQLRDNIIYGSNPFGNNVNAPIFMMHDAAYFQMREKATFQMGNGAVVSMQGNAEVQIGGGQILHAGESTSYLRFTDPDCRTRISVEPYSMIIVRGNHDNDGTIWIEPNHVFIGSCFGRTTEPLSSSSKGRISGYLFDGTNGMSTSRSFYGTQGTSGMDVFAFNRITTTTDFSNQRGIMESKITGPGFMLQGKAVMQIDGNAPVGIYIGQKAGSFAMDLGGYGDTNIKFAPGGNFCFDCCPPGGTNHFQYSPDGGTHTFAFHQSGITSVRFDSKSTFGLNFEAYNTEIECKWNKMLKICDGNDHFIQMDGNTHLESWSGTVILRNSNPSLALKTDRYYPYFSSGTNYDKSGSIDVYQDLSSYTQSDLITEFDTQLKNTIKPDSNTYRTYEFVEYRSVTKNKQPSTYTETLEVNNVVRRINSLYITLTNYVGNNITPENFINNSYVKAWFTRAYGSDILTLFEGATVSYNGSYTSYGTIYYQYTFKLFGVVYNKTITNTVNSTSSYELNMPNIPSGEATEEQITIIKKYFQIPSTSYTSGSIIWAGLDTGAYTTQENFHYKVQATLRYSYTISHLDKNWRYLIQTADRVGSEDWDKAPIIQAYGPVNMLLREKWQGIIYYNTFSFTSEHEYDLTDMRAAVLDFINGSDYAAFETYIEQNYQPFEPTASVHYMDIAYLVQDDVDPIQYTVIFNVYNDGKAPYLDSYPDCPVVEITDASELRLHNGAKITADVQYGETVFTFENTTTEEEPVSFTLAELKALKDLLVNPPL